MDALNFCYWLNGWTELQNPSKIDAKQLQEIKNHLELALRTEKLKNTTAITVDEDNKKVTYCQPSAPVKYWTSDPYTNCDCRQTTINTHPEEILIC